MATSAEVPDFAYEQCANCPGEQCAFYIKSVGAFPLFFAIDGAKRVKEGDWTMDRAASSMRSLKADPGRIPRSATNMKSEFSCGWSEDHLISVFEEATEFYELNPPL
ncbi:MAG TPA: hypothetical protein VMR34_03670 [Candidatus Saccharimonadales bacterium]|nr:hypothetical protein [Candidatus Saccharimonadales bacterium]